MPTKKRIRPERKRCDCGSKVKNHHWLCDKCWGKKAKRKHFIKLNKIKKMNKKKNQEKEIIPMCIVCGDKATHVRRSHKREWLYFCGDCKNTKDMPIKY